MPHLLPHPRPHRALPWAAAGVLALLTARTEPAPDLLTHCATG
jgi:hypothetical protein